jgi:hypothetical protein
VETLEPNSPVTRSTNPAGRTQCSHIWIGTLYGSLPVLVPGMCVCVRVCVTADMRETIWEEVNGLRWGPTWEEAVPTRLVIVTGMDTCNTCTESPYALRTGVRLK